ncbi:hypothetical protein ACWEQG_02045 [Microbispora sp. NPDC004025]
MPTAAPYDVPGQDRPDLRAGQAEPDLEDTTSASAVTSPAPAAPVREKRVTEPAELAANLARFFNRMEDHAADDPANLVLLDELTAYLRDCKLRAIARAARAASEGGDYSINHIAGILGIRKQSLHELMRKGQALLAAKRARLGVVDLRERRRRRLDEAGVPERRAAGL